MQLLRKHLKDSQRRGRISAFSWSINMYGLWFWTGSFANSITDCWANPSSSRYIHSCIPSITRDTKQRSPLRPREGQCLEKSTKAFRGVGGGDSAMCILGWLVVWIFYVPIRVWDIWRCLQSYTLEHLAWKHRFKAHFTTIIFSKWKYLKLSGTLYLSSTSGPSNVTI